MLKKSLILLIILFSLLISTSFKTNNMEIIRVSAIGDIMAHLSLQEYILTEKDGYLSLFKKTNKIFFNDDLTIGNLETPICDNLPIEGFPCFNAKKGLVDAISKSSIEVLSLANNHAIDQGIPGIRSTIDEVKNKNIIYTGAGYTPDEAMNPKIIKINGIIIGIISVTWTTNILQKEIVNNRPYVYQIFMEDTERLNQLYNKIKNVRKKVDLLIVTYHAGKEYSQEPINIKKTILKNIADSGADVVLSHHPHVLQPVEYYNTKDKREVLIAYSLGNFISAQARYINSLKKNDPIYDSLLSKTSEGIILQFDVIRKNKNIFIVNACIMPLLNVVFLKKVNNKYILGYQTILIDEILNINKDDNQFKSNINEVKKLASYRLKKIKELIKLPVKKIN